MIIAHLLGGLRFVVVGTINAALYVVAKIATAIYHRSIRVESFSAVVFRRAGEMLPDGSYEPKLEYGLYVIKPGELGFHHVGDLIISPKTAVLKTEFDPDDEVRLEFSKSGLLNPLTLDEDRGRWLRLGIEMLNIAYDKVQVE